MKKLTAKQQRFVDEYLIDLNATRAAREAGYSAKTAEQQGSRLLRNVQVAAAVKQAVDARAERVEVKADDVLRELIRLAMVDVGDAYDENGALKPFKEWPLEVRRAVTGVKETKYGRVVEFGSKVASLELLGRHLQLFTDKVKHEGQVGVTVIVQQIGKGKAK